MDRRSKINVIKHFWQQTIEIGKPLSQRVGKTRTYSNLFSLFQGTKLTPEIIDGKKPSRYLFLNPPSLTLVFRNREEYEV